ncbi:MAG: hypothetical protein K8L99_29410 [Anaerolineae bacterium]|nr:hypothetical protein [Anaerolineae bacterium]
MGKRIFGVVSGVVALCIPVTAYSACTSPAGNEGDLRYDSTAKAVYFCDGTNWQGMGGSGSGPAVPTDIKITTSQDNGSFNGFTGMQAFIEANGCAGYQICHVEDIQRYNMFQSSAYNPSSDAWVAIGEGDNGNATYSVEGTCSNWNSSNSGVYGFVLKTSGSIGYTGCNNSRYVVCCKFD